MDSVFKINFPSAGTKSDPKSNCKIAAEAILGIN